MKNYLHNSLRALFLSLALFLTLPMWSVEIDGINYKLVTKGKLATVIKKYGNKYSGDIVIPETVERNGTTYSVTSIDEQAFYDCTGLISVTIPNSVTSIGDYAFYCSTALKNVYCYAEKVPSTESDAFSSSPIADATLHVPNASVDSYKATAPWSSFGKIVALTVEETGIDELKGENGTENSAIYDLSGRRVQKAEKGIFIQNGKVMVK